MKSTIISDIDGTLLWRAESLTNEVLQSIKQFSSNQNYFSICTGRSLLGCSQILSSLSAFLNCPSIFFGGSLVWDAQNHKEISITYCNDSILHIINQIYMKYPSVSITVNTKEDSGTLRTNDILMNRGTYYDRHAPFIAQYELKTKRILKVLLTSKEPTIIKEISAELINPSLFHATFASTHFFEITDSSVNKGKAIEIIKERFPEIRETIIWAAGDAPSDITMKGHVNRFACPSDAHPEVYKIADYIFPSPKDTGIIHLINHIQQ